MVCRLGSGLGDAMGEDVTSGGGGDSGEEHDSGVVVFAPSGRIGDVRVAW